MILEINLQNSLNSLYNKICDKKKIRAPKVKLKPNWDPYSKYFIIFKTFLLIRHMCVHIQPLVKANFASKSKLRVISLIFDS